METTLARDVDEKCNQELARPMDHVEKFKYIAIKRVGLSGLKTVGKSFRIMDRDRSGRLDREEFRTGCERWGMRFKSEEEFDAFTRNFDRDGSGCIDYEEFLVAVRPPMKDNRKALVKKAFYKIHKTGGSTGNVQQKPASGSKKTSKEEDFITIEDLALLYKVDQHPKFKNGEMTREQVLKQFLDSFQPGDKDKDDKVTLEEFMDYYSAISLSVDNEAMFSFIMHSSWGVSPCESVSTR